MIPVMHTCTNCGAPATKPTPACPYCKVPYLRDTGTLRPSISEEVTFTFTIRQDFRAIDPEAVARAFRRDFERMKKKEPPPVRQGDS